MKRLLGCGMVCALAWIVASGGASALTWTTVNDPTDDQVGSGYQIYAMGYAYEADRLYFSIMTNFPEAGRDSYDSYAYTHLDSGDLWINAAGTIYGLAFTTHANVVQQAYSGTWPTVTQGNLYRYAIFADGTLEQYEEWVQWRGILPTPLDGDPYDGQNHYPTLIRGYAQEIAGQSDVQWNSVSGMPWLYEITGSFSTTAVGLDPSEPFDLFWSMECGNDAVMISGTIPGAPIPEPATMLLVGAGILGLRRVRRRRGA